MLRLACLFILTAIVVPNGFAQHHCSHHRAGSFLTDPANQRSDTLNVLHYDLSLDMTQIFNNLLTGHCRVDFMSEMDGINWISLDLQGLEVDSVTADGQMLNFTYEDPLLVVNIPQVLNSGDLYSVTVHYGGDPDTDPTWGGFYTSPAGYAYNMGVGFDADPHNFGRVWFPCFDNFVEKSTYSFHVLSSGGKTAYCNGIRASVDTVGTDSLLTHWNMDVEIPSYLASVAVSDYVHSEWEHENLEGEITPVWLTARAADTLEMKQSMVNLLPAIEGFENRYGLHRFPRVGFCAVPFNGGAMEHATNIAYPLFAIDGTLAWETLYAHELSHHWWGDNVTCRTAGDMWINEGWARYSEALFTEFIYGTDAYRAYIRDNHKDVLLKAHIRDGGRYPVSPVPHNITYGDHVYNKGADVAHTLRGYMGDEDFFEAIQALMETYQYDDIDSEELKYFMQQYTPADIDGFFNGFVYDIGFPEFRIISSSQTGSLHNLVIEQNLHYAASLYANVPLDIRYIGTEGEILDTTFVMQSELQSIDMDPGFTVAHVVLNPFDELSQAVLGEEQTFGDEGLEDFDYAEMEIPDVVVSDPTDGFWIRVENHFTAANEPAFIPGTEYFISPDRCWYVQGDIPDDAVISARIKYYGNDGSNSYYDPQFFTWIEENGFDEDSIILLYRPDALSEWTEPDNYILNTQGSSTNWTGRIEINGLRTGWYAWAVRTGTVNLIESIANTWAAWFNMGGELRSNLHDGEILQIFDMSGKLVGQDAVQSGVLATGNLGAGAYLVRRMTDGTELKLIKAH